MTIKKLYIIRHGETDYNKCGVVQGSGINSSLNNTGRAQAQQFYELNKHVDFHKVYVSELNRTHESVTHFVEAGIPFEVLGGLNEISWGIKEGEEVSFDPHSYYGRVVQAWSKGDLQDAIEGGESPLQVAERQKEALSHILAQPEETNVLICMHGRAMRILVSQLLGTPLHQMDQYEHSNMCLYLLEWDGSGFVLVERNRAI